MKNKFLISVLLVSMLIMTTISFAAINKVSFALNKYTMGLGLKQSLTGIMEVYGHELDYDNFTIEDTTVIKFTNNGKSIEAVGTGLSKLTYVYENSKGEEKTISCYIEVNVTSPVPGSNTDVYHKITIHSGDLVSQTECKRGLKPELPNLQREGYIFAGWYLDENFENEYKLNWIQSDLTLYAKWLVAGSEPVVVAPQQKEMYSDITNHWAKGKIEYVTREGIFNGTGNDTFSPDVPMTRAMVVTVLGRIAGVKAEGRTTAFTDVVKGAYYEEYVAWAVENGIAKGVSETEFNPDRNITREELAVMFANYIKYTGKDYGEIEEIDYNDKEEISEWAIDAVKTLKSYNVMKGNDENKFSPKAVATRAEVAVVFYNFYMIKG